MVHEITIFDRSEVTEDILREASKLYNENYGYWDPHPEDQSLPRKPGSRLKLRPAQLRAQCLPEGSNSSYVRLTVNRTLAGCAFVCRWDPGGFEVCWITQFVMHREYLTDHLSMTLLRAVWDEDIEVMGIASSNPFALKALVAAYADFKLPNVNFDFIKNSAAPTLEKSPIYYLKNAELRGKVFDDKDDTGLTCGIDTNSLMDNTKPREIVSKLKEDWPFGNLPDGHAYLLFFPVIGK